MRRTVMRWAQEPVRVYFYTGYARLTMLDACRAIVITGDDDAPRNDNNDLPLWYFDYQHIRTGWRALSIHFPQADERGPGQQAGGLPREHIR
jgi:hypothetical protein